MKKIYFVLLIYLSLICWSCGNKQSAEVTAEEQVVTEVVAEEVNDGVADIPYNKRYNHHNALEIKTYTIGDYIFTYRYSYMIGNEAVTVLDKQGKMIAIAGSASQSVNFDNFIRYLYDEDGNHIGFARIGDCDYPENLETFNKPYEDCGHFDMLYYNVCVRKPDDAGLERYMFRYDDAGVLKGIYDPINGYALNAPEGAYIKWRIEEGASFWESDLRGAEYYLLFFIMPLGEGFYGNSLCYDVYDGYLPYDYEGDSGQY